MHSLICPSGVPTATILRRGAHGARLRTSSSSSSSSSRGASLRVQAARTWWDSAPFLPPRVKEAAKEIEFFNGNPIQRVLPWMSTPKATPPGRPDPKDAVNSLVLFDFTAASPDSDPDRFSRVWGELNDVVMGGKSEGAATVVSIPAAEGGKCAKLSGLVEGRGGGFVSMRTRNFITPLNLDDYDGIRMRVRGDGRRYKLILRDTEDFFDLSYHASFDTVEGEWMDVEFSFDAEGSSFTPVLRAAAVKKGESDYRELRKSRIFSLQLMMSKYENGMSELNPTFASGPISLEVASITAFKSERAVVKQVLESAIINNDLGGGSGGAAGSSA